MRTMVDGFRKLYSSYGLLFVGANSFAKGSAAAP